MQGVGGALMLPASVAILSTAYPSQDRGRALGMMGGIAAVAGALGQTISGVLTSVFSCRAVLLINLPLLCFHHSEERPAAQDRDVLDR